MKRFYCEIHHLDFTAVWAESVPPIADETGC